MHRRTFVAGACTAALTVPAFCRSAHAIDPFERPKPGKLKLSLAAYSMRKYLPQNPLCKMDKILCLFHCTNLQH